MRASTPVPELPPPLDAEAEPGVRRSARPKTASHTSAPPPKRPRHPPPLPALPAEFLVAHPASAGRLFTAVHALGLSKEATAELERKALLALHRVDRPSEPPAYSWVKQQGKKELEPHWEFDANLLRLLSLSDAAALTCIPNTGIPVVFRPIFRFRNTPAPCPVTRQPPPYRLEPPPRVCGALA